MTTYYKVTNNHVKYDSLKHNLTDRFVKYFGNVSLCRLHVRM